MNSENGLLDIILDELHATRQQLLLEHGGVAGLAAYLRQEEKKCNWPIVESGSGPRSDQTDHPGRNRRAVRG
jgi:hypothetical protein